MTWKAFCERNKRQKKKKPNARSIRTGHETNRCFSSNGIRYSLFFFFSYKNWLNTRFSSVKESTCFSDTKSRGLGPITILQILLTQIPFYFALGFILFCQFITVSKFTKRNLRKFATGHTRFPYSRTNRIPASVNHTKLLEKLHILLYSNGNQPYFE